MPRTIFFDLGNVLLFFDTLKMYRQIAQCCALELEEVASIFQHRMDPYEKGLIDTKKIYEDFCRLSKQPIEYPRFVTALADIFKQNDSVIDIVQELKTKGHPLFVLSNTCESHFEFALSQYPFLQLFDGYVLSYKVGARKPQKKIFEKALQLAKCEKDQCFYIDDIPEFVNAAKALHIDAERYTTTDQLKSQLCKRKIL